MDIVIIVSPPILLSLAVP